jgi:hypothetical protein
MGECVNHGIPETVLLKCSGVSGTVQQTVQRVASIPISLTEQR